ncbi:MAG: hypothetical protein A2097_03545 [Desulfobacula sp. GWF2_41_7]|nr:MAG: hypothetical protein A2097_03545 [Desulfobacula sp. GWF2_41_7]
MIFFCSSSYDQDALAAGGSLKFRETRVVSEIDGAPAAEEYANILGFKIQELSPQVFTRYPVMLEIGDQWYVRSIKKVNPDADGCGHRREITHVRNIRTTKTG